MGLPDCLKILTYISFVYLNDKSIHASLHHVYQQLHVQSALYANPQDAYSYSKSPQNCICLCSVYTDISTCINSVKKIMHNCLLVTYVF